FLVLGEGRILGCGHLSGKTEIKRCENLSEITATFPRHSRESGNLGFRTGETFLPDKFPCRPVWIPACAGMTGFWLTVFVKMAKPCKC
ncbi:hypothetical protein, partial [Neisseria meningitidis]|uniref:hypothetical protein n=1 Tax=Neisseria meningitidis TaxID=487 RepID=UPI00197DF365